MKLIKAYLLRNPLSASPRHILAGERHGPVLIQQGEAFSLEEDALPVTAYVFQAGDRPPEREIGGFFVEDIWCEPLSSDEQAGEFIERLVELVRVYRADVRGFPPQHERAREIVQRAGMPLLVVSGSTGFLKEIAQLFWAAGPGVLAAASRILPEVRRNRRIAIEVIQLINAYAPDERFASMIPPGNPNFRKRSPFILQSDRGNKG